jgi:molecular chaperone Hsp33
MMGSLLMAAHQKQGHSVGVYFRGNGPLGVIFAESTHDGACRAYTGNPQLEIPLKDGHLDISGAIGHGLLEVVRGVPNSTQNHSGTVIIKTGEIATDLAYYLEQSMQIPAALALGVEVDEYGVVKGAGGMLVELFPGAQDKIITKIEQNLAQGGSVSRMVSNGATPDMLVKAFLKDFELDQLPHDPLLRYECRCTLDKVKNALVLLGHQEIDELIAKKEAAQAKCEFCGRVYKVGIDELAELRRESFKRSLN